MSSSLSSSSSSVCKVRPAVPKNASRGQGQGASESASPLVERGQLRGLSPQGQLKVLRQAARRVGARRRRSFLLFGGRVRVPVSLHPEVALPTGTVAEKFREALARPGYHTELGS